MLSSRRLGKISWVVLPVVVLCLIGYLLVSAGVLAGDGSEAQTTDSLLANGRAALTAEKYDDAIASARRLLELSTDSEVRVRAYRLMISAVRSRDGYDAAIAMAEKEYLSVEKSSPSASEELRGLRTLIADLKQCQARYLTGMSEQKKLAAAYPSTERAAEAALKMADYRRLLGNKSEGIAAYEDVVKSYPVTRPGWKAAQELALLRGGKSLNSENLESALKEIARGLGNAAAVKRAWEMASGASYPDVLRLEALASALKETVVASENVTVAEVRNDAGRNQPEEAIMPKSCIGIIDAASEQPEVAAGDQVELTDFDAENAVASKSESRSDSASVNAVGGVAMPTIGGGLSLPGVALAGDVAGPSSSKRSKAAAKMAPNKSAQVSGNNAQFATPGTTEIWSEYRPPAWHVMASAVKGDVTISKTKHFPDGPEPCTPQGTLYAAKGGQESNLGTVTGVDQGGGDYKFTWVWHTCDFANGEYQLRATYTCGATDDGPWSETVRNVRVEEVTGPDYVYIDTNATFTAVTDPGDGGSDG